MSTTYTLLEQANEDAGVIYLLDITEQSMLYSIAASLGGLADEEPGEPLTIDTQPLAADQVIGVALKLLKVILYQYPEKMPDIIDKLQKLSY